MPSALTDGASVMDVRTGQAPAMLAREEFGRRFRMAYRDPLFDDAKDAIAQLEEIAWKVYVGGRKSPLTTRAGPGFSDPDFPLSVEWLATRQRLVNAQAIWARPESPTRVLLVCGASRNDGTCPGEMSKTFRLLELIRGVFAPTGMLTDVLDLSLRLNMGVASIRARAACRRRCRCATVAVLLLSDRIGTIHPK